MQKIIVGEKKGYFLIINLTILEHSKLKNPSYATINYSQTATYPPPHVIIKLLIFLGVFISLQNLKAQNCSNATGMVHQQAFDFIETNGAAYAFINLHNDVLSVGVNIDQGGTWPHTWTLLEGNCGGFNTVSTGPIQSTEDNLILFNFDSLQIGLTYYLKMEGSVGSGFILHAFPKEDFQSSGTCNTPVCDFIQNGSFEQAESQFNSNNPIGGVAQLPLTYAPPSHACGWDVPQSFSGNPAANNTPDYLLANAHSSYGLNCTGPIGNSCNTNTQSGSGVLHLFSMDARAGFNRREYIMQQINNTMIEGRFYYVSLWSNLSFNRFMRSSAIQVLFPTTADMSNNPISNSQPITTWGTPQVDFSSQIDVNQNGWQQSAAIFQYTNSAPSEHIVIGNFLDNATTLNFSSAIPPQGMNTHHFIPSQRIDDIQVFALPYAGEDLVLCTPQTVIIGSSTTCSPATTGAQISWEHVQSGMVVSTNENFSIAINTPGTHTYKMTVYFNGLSYTDEQTIYLAPQPYITSIVNNDCDATAEFYLGDATGSFNVSISGANYSSYNLSSNGNLIIYNPEVTSNTGYADITISGSISFQGTMCPFNLNTKLYSCCDNSLKSDYFFPPNTNVTSTIPNTLNIVGKTITVAGTVIINDNFTFDNCKFYLLPDAELEIDANVQVAFTRSTFQACNAYKWDRIYNPHASSTLFMEDCTLQDAIRGVHLIDDATANFTDNLFRQNVISQLIENYSNANGVLTWEGNRFEHSGPSFGTTPHPNSGINWLALVANNVNKSVGIKMINVQDFSLDKPNSFWSSDPTGDESHHFWADNSTGTVAEIDFEEGLNILCENGEYRIFDNQFYKSIPSSGISPSGIEAINSKITIGDLNATPFSNYFLNHANINIVDPIETYIYKNQISATLDLYGVKIFSTTLSSSRTKVQENDITAQTCVQVSNLKSDWQTSSNQKVYINNNFLYPTKSNNSTGNTSISTGIHVYNCEGISIGENEITHNYGLGITLPDSTTNYLSVGIQLTESRNAFVGCNEILYAGRALAFSGDVTRDSWLDYDQNGSPIFPIQFQSNKFKNYYFGIYIGIGTTISSIGQNTSGKKLAADNEWLQILGLPISSADRVKDDRVNQGPGDYINYYFTGVVGTNNTKYPDSPNSPYVASTPNLYPNNCSIAVPSSKTTANLPTTALVTYPNPTDGILNYSIPQSTLLQNYFRYNISIIGIDGKTHLKFLNKEITGTINVETLSPGIYVLKAINGTSVYIARFVCN